MKGYISIPLQLAMCLNVEAGPILSFIYLSHFVTFFFI